MSTRRYFIQTTASAGLSAAMGLSQHEPVLRSVSANDAIQIALIGCGGMGMGDVRSSLLNSGVKLIAGADIYDGRLARMKELHGKDLYTTRDYREVLARKDVDAVIVATPDHLHARIAIDAMNAGKDVYCEKPMIQRLGEGHAVIETQKKTHRIFQVGSQRVSSLIYQKAKDLFRAGVIGKLNLVEAWIDRNSALGAWQYSIPPDASPATIDWDAFVAHTKKIPFDPIKLFRWRNYQQFGTGVGGDLFVHLFSGIHFILDSAGPERIFATGGLRSWDDGRNVPDVMLGLFDYPQTKLHTAFTLALRVNLASGAGENSMLRFVGDEGTITLDRDVSVTRAPQRGEPGYSIGTFPKAIQEQFLAAYREKYPIAKITAAAIRPASEERYIPPRDYNDHVDHHANFVASVRTRQPAVEDATFGYRAAAPAVACNISYFEQRVVRWNPEKMQTL